MENKQLSSAMNAVRAKKVELDKQIEIETGKLFLSETGLSVGDLVKAEFQHTSLYERRLYVNFSTVDAVICEKEDGGLFLRSKNTLTVYYENYTSADKRRYGKFSSKQEYKTASIYSIKDYCTSTNPHKQVT